MLIGGQRILYYLIGRYLCILHQYLLLQMRYIDNEYMDIRPVNDGDILCNGVRGVEQDNKDCWIQI